MKGVDKMISNDSINQEQNLTSYNILQNVKIFGAENLLKSDVSENNITIPDNNNRIPIGYY